MKAKISVEMRTDMFIMLKVTSRMTHNAHHYIIRLHGMFKPDEAVAKSMRDFFDPDGTRSSKRSFKWKFKDREQAVKLMTMSILKWGA